MKSTTLKQFYGVCKKEFDTMRSTGNTIFPIVAQTFVATFVVFVVVFLGASTFAIGFAGDIPGGMYETTFEQEHISSATYENETELKAQIENGNIDVGLYGERVGDEYNMTMFLSSQNIQQISIFQETQLLIQRSETAISSESYLFPTPPENTVFNNFYYQVYIYVIPFLLLFPAFLTGNIILDTFSGDIDSGLITLIHTLPISFGTYITSKVALLSLFTPLQVLITFGILSVGGLYISESGFMLFIVFSYVLTVCLGLMGVILRYHIQDSGFVTTLYGFGGAFLIIQVSLFNNTLINSVIGNILHGRFRPEVVNSILIYFAYFILASAIFLIYIFHYIEAKQLR